jgi:hypothetical protein
MEEIKQKSLIDLVNEVYQDVTLMEEHQKLIEPMLTELVANAPDGFEGMATMINTHISNSFKFKSPNVQKFEIESGLIKLKMYIKKTEE